MVVGLGWVGARLYRDSGAQRERHAGELAALSAQCLNERMEHAAEMTALQERFISKADTWINKHHETAASLSALLEAAQRHGADRRRG